MYKATGWGVREVARAWLRGRSSGRVALCVPSAAPLSLRELGRVRVGQARGFYSPIWWQYAVWQLQVSAAVLLSGNARLRMADWGSFQACLFQGGRWATGSTVAFSSSPKLCTMNATHTKHQA
ncbi:hypothetical protein BC826DRAFT_969995 [Russula brevipes]|nr:hypothetical protein BC826DRAFT_969995 [Russula brevipes]